jgi:hypothetical protein
MRIPLFLFTVVERINRQRQFDTSKNTSKTNGCSEFLCVLLVRRANFSEKSGIEPVS